MRNRPLKPQSYSLGILLSVPRAKIRHPDSTGPRLRIFLQTGASEPSKTALSLASTVRHTLFVCSTRSPYALERHLRLNDWLWVKVLLIRNALISTWTFYQGAHERTKVLHIVSVHKLVELSEHEAARAKSSGWPVATSIDRADC